jgi:hypothetical protein
VAKKEKREGLGEFANEEKEWHMNVASIAILFMQQSERVSQGPRREKNRRSCSLRISD